jgi:hypothetical protein
VDVAGGEGGTAAAVQLRLVEATLDLPLAVGQLLAYLGFHSKSLRAMAVSCRVQT